jgi:hypothetical protein
MLIVATSRGFHSSVCLAAPPLRARRALTTVGPIFISLEHVFVFDYVAYEDVAEARFAQLGANSFAQLDANSPIVITVSCMPRVAVGEERAVAAEQKVLGVDRELVGRAVEEVEKLHDPAIGRQRAHDAKLKLQLPLALSGDVGVAVKPNQTFVSLGRFAVLLLLLRRPELTPLRLAAIGDAR